MQCTVLCLHARRPIDGQPSLIGEANFHAFATDVGLQLSSIYPCSIQWLHASLQIAKGLEFLSSMKYVHRDIAARNCLGKLVLA